MLAKRPDERPSMEEVATVLNCILADDQSPKKSDPKALDMDTPTPTPILLGGYGAVRPTEPIKQPTETTPGSAGAARWSNAETLPVGKPASEEETAPCGKEESAAAFVSQTDATAIKASMSQDVMLPPVRPLWQSGKGLALLILSALALAWAIAAAVL
jgi:hypothetical protein